MATTKESKRETFRKVFKEFDKDGDSFINKKELKNLLARWKVIVSDEEADDIMNEIDKNKDGKIDFNEFYDYMEDQSNPRHDLRQTFKLFDKDGDGYISKKELTDTLELLGKKMGKAQINAILQEADQDGDGKISFDEFCRYFAKKDKTQQEQKK